MACTVENRRLYDTVTDTSFGPLCASEEEAEMLRYHTERTRGKDARAWPNQVLEEVLAEIRRGVIESVPTHPNKLCGCGNGKPFEQCGSFGGVMKTKCADGHDWVDAPEARWL